MLPREPSAPLLGGSGPPAWHRPLVGYSCLVGLIVAWVAQAEVAQQLETTLGYNKPCFVTWVNHSFSVFLFPLLLASHYATHGTRGVGWFSSLRAQGLTGRVALKASAQLATVFLLGDLLWYIGLAHTSVAMGSAIFNSSCALAYALSLPLLRQRPTALAVGALALTLGGVGLVAFAPPPAPSAPSAPSGGPAPPAPPDAPPPALGGDVQTVGNLLVFGAAACYAVYEVWTGALLQRNALPSSAEIVNTLNACMGLFNLLVMWVAVLGVQLVPPVGGLVWVHESFAWPSQRQAAYLLINALLAFAFNVFLMLGIAFTSPTLASVACVAAIPSAALVDFLLWDKRLTPMAAGGCGLICVGFVALAAAEHRAARRAEGSKVGEEAERRSGEPRTDPGARP